jgi:hypothetical protein
VHAWESAGPHRYFVQQDRIYWKSHGPVEPEHAHAFVQLLLRVVAQHDRAYCIVDARKMQPLPAESRRIYIEYLKLHQPRFTLAIFGAPLHIRVAGMLVVNAARLMSLPALRVFYAATEPEAEQYLLEQRARST